MLCTYVHIPVGYNFTCIISRSVIATLYNLGMGFLKW